jgi:integrase/recombinase XerD
VEGGAFERATLTMQDWSLFDAEGHRKYLTPRERRAFLRAASRMPVEVETFARVLCETGCRLSEALALTGDRIDVGAGLIVFETLKKRRSGVHRAVPVSEALIDRLVEAHGLKEAGAAEMRLWPWCRMTGYRRVLEIMAAADLSGLHATPKGLRHGFAIAALEKGIPLTLVQKWLGHASLSTTAIYLNAVGAEERRIASRLWS